MRTMKDKERFFLVVKIFLHMHGPATPKEISEYIRICPINFLEDFSPVKVGVLLRGQPWIKKEQIKGRSAKKYTLIK